MLKSKFLGYLVVVITALGVVAGFLSYRAIADPTGQTWQPLSELVTPAKLTEIVEESTAPSADREAIADSAIGYKQGDLLLVDFNTPDLCGMGGCALAGYRPSTGERVLFTYIQASAKPIVEVVERSESNLPCILVPTAQRSLFQGEQETLCLQGEQWGVVR